MKLSRIIPLSKPKSSFSGSQRDFPGTACKRQDIRISNVSAETLVNICFSKGFSGINVRRNRN